jgi:hypothetical protein
MNYNFIFIIAIILIIVFQLYNSSCNINKDSHEETYYFNITPTNAIRKINENEYINKFIFPLYKNSSMTDNHIGYYTARHYHKIIDNMNNVSVNATIVTPNGVILARNKYVTDKNDHYLDTTKMKSNDFNLDITTDEYKSAKITITLLSDTHRMLTITKS